MKRNSINRRYCKISNMEELKLERSRLSLQMELKEYEMKHNWEYVREYFSFRHLANKVLGGFGTSSVSSGIMTGLGAVGSIFKRKKKKRSMCGSHL